VIYTCFTNKIDPGTRSSKLFLKKKTPTLSHVLPAFEAIIEKWKDHQIEHFEVSSIIDEGLDEARVI